MQRYVFAKLGLAVPLLLGVSLIVFLLGAATPGDPVTMMLGEGAPTGEAERLRTRLGLDAPLHVQYVQFLGRIIQGDLGVSYRSKLPVGPYLLDRFPATVELAIAAMSFALLFGLTLGVLAALHPGTLLDRLAVLLASAGSSMPVFWSGLLLILLFSLTLGWLPASGRGSPQQLLMPALALGLGAAALLARLTRAALLEVLTQDYVRAARSRGLRERTVVVRHALRNALISVVAALGLQFGGLLAGAVLTETVFAWPGVGRLIVQAIEQRDLPVLRGAILLVSTTFMLVNLGADLLFAYLDPRIRYS